MKKITIGRGRECDIRLDDASDLVSRRQAVIRVSLSGKMEIFDLSSNGTFVNGEKVQKPNGMPIKRGDQINFAHVVDLDWNRVKDPYRKSKMTALFVTLAVAVVAVGFIFFDQIFPPRQNESTAEVAEVVQQEDTIPMPERQELGPEYANDPVVVNGKATRKVSRPVKDGGNATVEEENVKPDASEEYNISEDIRPSAEIDNKRKARNN